MEWNVDLRELKGIERWYGKQPRLMRQACGQMLNHFARGTRFEAVSVVHKQMKIRNKKFIEGRIQYRKTNTFLPVGQQHSYTGSRATKRFSGWVEQEYGTKTSRKRFATRSGRGGDEAKQLRHVARLKPGKDLVTIDSNGYKPKGPTNYGGFIAMLFRKKENRLIRIKGVILKRKRKELEVVQVLKAKQPKKKKWLAPARAIYFKKTNLENLWEKTVKPLMGKPSK